MTHAMCRGNVCLFCFEKKADCRVLSRTTALFQKVEFFTQFEDAIQFELNDSKVPAGVCATCRLKVSRRELKREDFSHFDFDFVSLPDDFESSSRKCSCSICQVAKSSKQNLKPFQKPNSKGDESNETSGPPSSSKIPKSRPSRPKERRHRCATCLQIIGRGIPHPQPCNTDMALEKNLKPIIHRSRKLVVALLWMLLHLAKNLPMVP